MSKFHKYSKSHTNRVIRNAVDDQLNLLKEGCQEKYHNAEETSDNKKRAVTIPEGSTHPGVFSLTSQDVEIESADNAACASSSQYLSLSSESDSSLSEYSLDPNKRTVDPSPGENDLKHELHLWALENSISHKALSELLVVLRKHSCHADLPKDARTLLQTPRKSNTLSLPDDANYMYLGVEKSIKNILSEVMSVPQKIDLTFNIDGVPLTKSSGSQIWPILCLLQLNQVHHVFPVALIHSYSKPKDANILLKDFVLEMKSLLEHGIVFNEKVLDVSFNALICDAPARAFVTKTKGHAGYFACSKCTTEGQFLQNRMCFPEINSHLRSNESFRQRKQEEYHVGDSLLEEILCLDMVAQFPLDYMHLVCLGIMRKLLLLWLRGNLRYRLPSAKVNMLSGLLHSFRNAVPREFARRPRTVREIDRWKATEFRQFLLYTGPVVLRNILSDDMYLHFLTLHCAITVLSSAEHVITLNGYAEELLKYFTQHFPDLYGKENVSYNVHSLIHLPADSLRYGVLENFSAFKFENHMQKLKKMVRKSEKPLQQLHNRMCELQELILPEKKINKINYENNHSSGPLVSSCRSPQYHKIVFHNFTLECKQPNNCCILNDGTVIFVENIAQSVTGTPVIIGRTFLQKHNLYTSPCNSSSFGIVVVKDIHELTYWEVNRIRKKCFAVPYHGGFVVFPLLHSLN